LTGAGLTQRTLYCRVIHPTSQRIALFLKPVQIGFHLCDTAGDFFGATAEVHPAEFIQLRLQMVYFALPVAQLFLQGVDQRFLFGQALFQQEDVVRKMSFISPYFTGLIL
ncbi:hypothetical protein AWF00_26165, partial [Escherichia coli]